MGKVIEYNGAIIEINNALNTRVHNTVKRDKVTAEVYDDEWLANIIDPHHLCDEWWEVKEMKISSTKRKQVYKFVGSIHPLERLEFAQAYLQRAHIMVAYQNYDLAMQLAAKAKSLFSSKEVKEKCDNTILYCKKRLLGILDTRALGIGIWYNNDRITEEDMNILLDGRSSSINFGIHGFKRSKGRSTKISISEAIFKLFDEKGVESISYQQAEDLAKELKPNTKFNMGHFNYYRSKYKSAKVLNK